jgi:hypothetical protein
MIGWWKGEGATGGGTHRAGASCRGVPGASMPKEGSMWETNGVSVFARGCTNATKGNHDGGRVTFLFAASVVICR